MPESDELYEKEPSELPGLPVEGLISGGYADRGCCPLNEWLGDDGGYFGSVI
jgi:hypothetical protein